MSEANEKLRLLILTKRIPRIRQGLLQQNHEERMKAYIKDILEEIEKIAGSKPEYLPIRGRRHAKVRLTILGTTQDFAITSKDFRAGCEKNNFYSQMRRKINERVELVKARQGQPN